MSDTQTVKPEEVINPLDAIIARYDTSGKEDIGDLELPDGTVFKCRRVRTALQMLAIEKHVDVQFELCQIGGTEIERPFLPDMRSPDARRIIRYAVLCEALLAPPNPMPFAKGLEVAKKCGGLMLELGLAVEAFANNTSVQEIVKKIEQKKIQSSETTLSESAS